MQMPRIAAATALVACMVMAFAALGGVGQAGNAISAGPVPVRQEEAGRSAVLELGRGNPAFAASPDSSERGNAITMHTTSAVAAAMPGIFDELLDWAPSLVGVLVLVHELMANDQ